MAQLNSERKPRKRTSFEMRKEANGWTTDLAPKGPVAAYSRRPAPKVTDSEEEPEEESVPEEATFQRRSSRSSGSSLLIGGGGPASGATARTQPAGFFAVPTGPQVSDDGIGRRMAGMSLGNDEDCEPDTSSVFVGPGGKATAPQAPTLPPATTQRVTPQPPVAPRAPPTTTSVSHSSAAAAPRRPSAGRAVAGGLGARLVVEEMEDFDSDYNEAASGGGNVLSSAITGKRGVIPVLQGQPVPQDTMRAIQQLLWGTQGQPPLSWKQGFFFSSKSDLRFGLVQLQGGPCGVLASVQAHVLAELWNAGGSLDLNPSSQQQQDALAAALAELLWSAGSGTSASVALPPSQERGSGIVHEQLMRGGTFIRVTSKDDMRSTLKAALPAYMDQEGWGVVLLLVSLILTRGVHVVRADMDESSNALMGMHGYCTQELVNLILTGRASSNVFDGDKALDGAKLGGISSPCRLGLLTLFEWYKYVEVGSHLKSPALPIWVVCSESHFTVLFSANTRPLRAQPPFELLYYDELANQEDLIRLTIRSDPAGGWTARVGDSFGDRGKCEGQNIPPLECVIETRWPGVKVDWNGTEPIL